MNPNRMPDDQLDTATQTAGSLKPGQWLRTVGGWDRVTSVRLAPDHAAVVIVQTESDPKKRRLHCDETVRVIA